jgi:hypothetical protein
MTLSGLAINPSISVIVDGKQPRKEQWSSMAFMMQFCELIWLYVFADFKLGCGSKNGCHP